LEWWKALNIPLPTFELCGDREFIGEKWLAEISKKNIKYVIRLRENLSFEMTSTDTAVNEKKADLIDIYKEMLIKNKQYVEIILRKETKSQIFFVKSANKNEEFIFFITNMDNISEAAKLYRKRWKIEVFFKHLKSAGFNLEGFNMPQSHKTDILMCILSIVYLVVYQLNKLKKEEKKAFKKRQNIENIRYKNGKTYKRKSDFRIGKSFLAKIKCLDSVLKVCEHITEIILDKLIFLRDLYIKDLHAQ